MAAAILNTSCHFSRNMVNHGIDAVVRIKNIKKELNMIMKSLDILIEPLIHI